MSVGGPTLVLIGEADGTTDPAYCKTLATAFGDTGKFTLVSYPGVHHSFDIPAAGDYYLTTVKGTALQRYDASAAADARRRTLEFFARWLGGV